MHIQMIAYTLLFLIQIQIWLSFIFSSLSIFLILILESKSPDSIN